MSRLNWFLVGIVLVAGLSAPAIWNLLASDRSGAPDWPVTAETPFDSPDESWDVVTSEGWSQGNLDVLNYKNEIQEGSFRFLFDVSEGRPGGTFWSRSDEFVITEPDSSYFEVDVQLDGPRGIGDPRYGFFIESPDEARVWQFYLAGEDSWEIWGPTDFLPLTPNASDETPVGDGINHISVLIRGGTVRFAINESAVYETRSSIPPDSRIRLFMAAREPSRSIFQVSFDNAVLKSKSP